MMCDYEDANLGDRAEIWSSLTKPRESQVPLWKTSRTRRTYLVSLGVPVDLDQILPTKQSQEQLVLSLKQKRRVSAQSASQSAGTTPRISIANDGKAEGDSLRRAHTTPAAVASSASAPVSRAGTPTVAPEFDIDRARQLSRVSEAALDNMDVAELKSHISALENAKIEASRYLAYWIDMRNTSEEDKTKYEGVIESSIEYAQRLRKNTAKHAALPRLSALTRTKSLQHK